MVKSGHVKGRQRYQCKRCGYLYSVSQKSDNATEAQRRMALTLYVEALGIRSIGRLLGFSHVAIYQWDKTFGERIRQLKASPAQIVERDEMHSYVGHKKTIAGSGLLLTDLESAYCMLSLAPEVLSPGGNVGIT